MTEIEVCLLCGESKVQCQCCPDPLVQWHLIRHKLTELAKALAQQPNQKASPPGFISPFDQIQELGKKLILIEGCDPDCDCRICHSEKRNAWSEDYPNIPNQNKIDTFYGPIPEIFIVELCQNDDYRITDWEFFKSREAAIAYIGAVNDGEWGDVMIAQDAVHKVSWSQAKSFRTALELFEEKYGDEEANTWDSFGKNTCDECGGLVDALAETKRKKRLDQDLCSCGE